MGAMVTRPTGCTWSIQGWRSVDHQGKRDSTQARTFHHGGPGSDTTATNTKGMLPFRWTILGDEGFGLVHLPTV